MKKIILILIGVVIATNVFSQRLPYRIISDISIVDGDTVANDEYERAIVKTINKGHVVMLFNDRDKTYSKELIETVSYNPIEGAKEFDLRFDMNCEGKDSGKVRIYVCLYTWEVILYYFPNEDGSYGRIIHLQI